MDLFPILLIFQLQFGQSCTLPFVKPSKVGFLGLEEGTILLTDSTYDGNVVHKAEMISWLSSNDSSSHFNNNITDLNFVTHFDASRSAKLCSDNLKQLAMTCPNLKHLDLERSYCCLMQLQGLYVISIHCKYLRRLNILHISEVENHVWLWKILVDMRLVYLATELCVLIPRRKEGQFMPEIDSFKEFLNLKALQFHRSGTCNNCAHRQRDLSVLSNFPSIVHCIVGNTDHIDVILPIVVLS